MSGLFPEVDSNDVPFLLRLTHLLDQRERSWFVQAETKDAGSRLARLPVGREGSAATAAIGPLRKTVSDRLRHAGELASQVANEISEWEALISQRLANEVQVGRVTRTVAEIASELQGFAVKFDLSIEIPVTANPSTKSSASIQAYHRSLMASVRVKQTLAAERSHELAALAGTIVPYEAERKRGSEIEDQVSVLKSDIERGQSEIAQHAIARELVAREIELGHRRLGELGVAIDAIRAAEISKERLEHLNASYAAYVAESTVRENEAALLRVEADRIQRVLAEASQASSKVAALMQALKGLDTAADLAVAWARDVEEEASLTSAMRACQEGTEAKLRSYSEAVNTHAAAARRHSEAKARQAIASSAVDVVRQALSVLVTQLPEGSEDCPACGVHHGADELQRRLKKSLETGGPDLQAAESDLRKASEGLANAESEMAATLADLQLSRKQAGELSLRVDEISRRVQDYLRNDQLAGSGSPAEATGRIVAQSRRLSAELLESRASLDEQMQRLEPGQPDRVRAELAAAEERLESYRAEIRGVRESIARETAELARHQSISNLQSTAQLEIDRMALEAEVLALRRRTYDIAVEVGKVEEATLRRREQLAKLQEQLGALQSRVAVIESHWRALLLPGKPSEELVAAYSAAAAEELREIASAGDCLASLAIDIDINHHLESQGAIQEILDMKRGSYSEAEHAASLRARQEEAQLNVQELARLSSALETLSKRLALEIENIHDHVTSVVPSWQGMLKQIIRDQRFASTSLDFHSHYRKEHASVHVPLHGADTPVPLVASEAQMTDLQLTFLLSMAVNHRWSRWRGLLLDDPTQHHDLVHASSVFDVLRDYIVDHSFQVVIATHDAAQAGYFRRKLLNDGVDARIWSLVPEEGGVVARLSR
ncbi:hypothetical protein [Stenotrophomonas rhizophila]|uniref:Chromosome segregation protein SMC n=1 Tax=Stenotrophomonas rhizophila TaxID=216778 RepID=A0AAW5PPF3_9GAMM|nr:hypothetical protein [Stenotrophomonas rhizophila]MCS4281583.1 hypothetical protein [Stenotrophomonas rhizophila]